MKKIFYPLFLTLLLLTVVPLSGEIVRDGDEWRVYDEQYSDEIEFKYSDVLLEPNTVGSKEWLPADCGGIMPIALLFYGEYGAKMGVKMRGRAKARWPESVKVFFEGMPDGGFAEMFYGINMEAKWKNCYDSDQEPQELSKWLNFDLSFKDEKTFQPFLLDGNVDNPVSMEDSIDNFQLYEGSLADMVGGGCGISIPAVGDICSLIHFNFELDGKMYVDMFGSRIGLDEKQERSIFSDNQYLVIEPPLVGTVMDIPVFFESKTFYNVVFTFTITVTIRILEIDIPIPIEIEPVREETLWQFNSQNVKFDFPAVFIESRSHKFADTMPGDEDFWEFDVENIGTRAMEAKVASDDPNFIVIPDTLNIEPGAKSTVTVFFKPYDVGTQKGVVTIYSNDPVEPVTKVSLFGYSSENDTQWTQVIEGDEPRWEVGTTNSGCSISVIGGE